MGRERIWPGPECLEPSLVSAALSHPNACVRAMGQSWQAAQLRRIEAIGRARVQAHRRHLRYRSWLLSMGWRDVAMVRRSEEARAYLSPEAHVLAAAADGRMWPFRAVGEPWLERAWSATCYHEAARAMVGSGEHRKRGPSAEWANLPWQQSPRTVWVATCEEGRVVCREVLVVTGRKEKTNDK